jgi:hypothetical protein
MIIADFEVSTNLDFAKKSRRSIAKRSGEKKRPLKSNGSQVFRNKHAGLLQKN